MKYNYSIIIPHYNIPELLVRCLNSIPQRDDMQVIVIDDGSPDAKNYLKKYPELSAQRVEFHSVKHQGLAGEMRNIGLSYATGKWVLFVDADDFLSDHADALLTDNLKNEEDIVFHMLSSVQSDDTTLSTIRADNYNSYYSNYIISGDTNLYRHYFYPVHGKIYKRDFIESNLIRFDKTKYSNDVFFSLISGHLAKNIKVNDAVLYVVTSRNNSLASNLYLKIRPSLEECSIRMNVAIRENQYMRKNDIKIVYDMRKKYLSILRSDYKLHYYKYLSYLLLIDPCFASSFIKRDIKYLCKKVFDRVPIISTYLFLIL